MLYVSWMGWDGMVIRGHRYSKGTYDANKSPQARKMMKENEERTVKEGQERRRREEVNIIFLIFLNTKIIVQL